MDDAKKLLLAYYRACPREKQLCIFLSLLDLLEDYEGESFCADYLEALEDLHESPGAAYQETELETLYSLLTAEDRRTLVQVARYLRAQRDLSEILEGAKTAKVYSFPSRAGRNRKQFPN